MTYPHPLNVRSTPNPLKLRRRKAGPRVPGHCDVCGERGFPLIADWPGRNYLRRCPTCWAKYTGQQPKQHILTLTHPAKETTT